MSVKEPLSRRLSMTSVKHILVISKQPWPKLFGTPQCEHSTISCSGPLARAPFQWACHFQRVMASAHVSMFPSPAHSCSWGAQGYCSSVSKHRTPRSSLASIFQIHTRMSRELLRWWRVTVTLFGLTIHEIELEQLLSDPFPFPLQDCSSKKDLNSSYCLQGPTSPCVVQLWVFTVTTVLAQ